MCFAEANRDLHQWLSRSLPSRIEELNRPGKHGEVPSTISGVMYYDPKSRNNGRRRFP